MTSVSSVVTRRVDVNGEVAEGVVALVVMSVE